VEEVCEGSEVLRAIGEELLVSPDFGPSLLSKLERGLDLLGLRQPGAERGPAELSTDAASFRLPQGFTAEELERRLTSRFGAAVSPETVEAKTFHDSFDWRIHRSGGTYQTLGFGPHRLHLWRETEGRVRHRLRHPGDPGFAAGFPSGALRDDLVAVLSIRRLLPVVTSSVRVRTIAVLDDEKKTTVRLRIESGTSSPPEGGELHELKPRITVAPVRGYVGERMRLAGFLREECGLLPDAAGELAHALGPLGRAPGDYTSKFELTLDPAMPARDAARAIHLSLLATLLRNEDGMRRDLDSEFLHDFRVAIRRTRSALTQIREVYPALDVERFKEEFRWLFIETGPKRDLDVYLLKMKVYREALPLEIRADLDPLEEFLERKQKLAHDRLVTVLDSERYRCLLEEWRVFLTEVPAGSLLARNAERPVWELASKRIWEIYRRMVKRGRTIDEDTPAAVLHDIRIRGKKLRYLLEFFRSLYSEDAIGRLVAELKRLQDSLGDFNDYRVQSQSLQGFAAEMAEEGAAPVRTHLAMGRLLAHLDGGQAVERSRFARRFEHFASPGNRRTFARLFSTGKRS
jgi:CHAD domain-containing protein